MAWLLPLMLLTALTLFSGWVAVMLRLEPEVSGAPFAPAPSRTAPATPASGEAAEPAAVLFPSFSGVGGDAGLLTLVDRAAA
jgi:hypothetical protein